MMNKVDIEILINRKSDFELIEQAIISNKIQIPIFIVEYESHYRVEFTSDYEEWKLDSSILNCFSDYEFTDNLEKGRKEIRLQTSRCQSPFSTDNWGRPIEDPVNETKYLIKKSTSKQVRFNPKVKVLFEDENKYYFVNIIDGIKKKLSNFLIGILIAVFTWGCKPDEPKLNNPLNGRTTAVFNPNKSYGTVTDIDGNIYKTIKIGDQLWIAENLRVTHYQNGNEIPNIKDSTQWANQTEGAYCNYNNIETLDTLATFGRLYNWYTTQDIRGLAPKGWRVANSVDWITIIDYLGGDTIAFKHLKESGTKHWNGPNNVDNSCGFTALPFGERYLKSNPLGVDLYAAFWTSSLYSETTAPFLFLTTWNDNLVYKGFNFKVNGYAIRCIKEQ